jgi:pimeloyl-ACP methyl ester carboxylesterase
MQQTTTAGFRASLVAPAMLAAFFLLAGLAVPSVASAKPSVGEFEWFKCNKQTPSLRCGVIVLPRDYSKPNGKKVALVAAKAPATGKRKGTIFYNPGGPGSSGVQQVLGGVASILPASIRRRFDFVSWDPRGVGQSRPSIEGCKAVGGEVETIPEIGIPTRSQWLSYLAEARAQQRQLGLQCLPKNLGIARHMGTNDVVRDLNMMRKAVGDRKLTYWGASYGTRIGYVYALRYPQRLRAILLDGSVDPRRGWREFARVRPQATDRALEVMARPRVRPAFAEDILATRDDLRVNGPITVEAGRFDQWTFQAFVGQNLFAQFQWTNIQELIDAINQVRGTSRSVKRAKGVIQEAYEDVRDRPLYPWIVNPRAGNPTANALLTNRIINRLDYSNGNIPSDVADEMLLNNVENHPFNAMVTASLVTNSAGIGSLKPDPVPLTSTPRFARIAREVENVLISGSTGDGATPAPWTAQMAASFPRAAVIRFNGWQHVNWMAIQSACVNDPITRFILTTRRPDPKRPSVCPFAPPAPPLAP